jgi:glucose/arabinose dehydrogenase
VPTVEYHEQGGLLGVAVDPDFELNRWVYLYYTEAAAVQPTGARLIPDPRLGPFVDTTDVVLKGGAVARGRLEGDELRNVEVIWRQEPKTIGMGHFGGRLIFGTDGTLFITSGERQRFEPAQDMASNLGKVIRINPDGSIPRDNPFVGMPREREDVWTVGHRNPLGAALHPETGALWVNEMGPLHGDELNLIQRGRNYGWPVVSDGDHYDGTPIPDHHTSTEFAPPILSFVPSIAPSGMTFYTGEIFPKWKGNVLMGGLVAQGLIRLTLEGTKVSAEERIGLGRRIRDVIQAPDGSMLLLVDGVNGGLMSLNPAPPDVN